MRQIAAMINQIASKITAVIAANTGTHSGTQDQHSVNMAPRHQMRLYPNHKLPGASFLPTKVLAAAAHRGKGLVFCIREERGRSGGGRSIVCWHGDSSRRDTVFV